MPAVNPGAAVVTADHAGAVIATVAAGAVLAVVAAVVLALVVSQRARSAVRAMLRRCEPNPRPTSMSNERR